MRQLLFMIILLTTTSITNAQTEVCSIRTYFRDLDAKISSSWFLVGEFPLSLEDDSINKLFHHQESSIDISVGVERIKSIFEKDPRRISVAIAFVRKPEDVFNETDNSEAETIYDKNWRWIAVSKNIKVENRIYTFQFSCERKKGSKHNIRLRF
jgi:hypothetical protein